MRHRDHASSRISVTVRHRMQMILRRRYDNYAKSKSRVAVAYRRATLIAHASAARSAGSHYLRQDSDISRALYDKQLFWLSQSRGLGETVLED